jgi:hypothetical protein
LNWLHDDPKDAEFLNTPIKFYTEMQTIFGSTLVTGRFALESSEPLGVNNVDSVVAKLEGHGFTSPPPVFEGKTTTELCEGSKATAPVTSTVGGKRKRATFSEDEMLMMSNMIDVVNNVANAMLKAGVAHVDPALYLAMMEMPDFSTEALIVAYTHLLENKALSIVYVNMTNYHREI